MQAYGLSRVTIDVDLLVEATAREAVVRFMESVGYETLHVSDGFSNHLHPDRSYGRVDFAYVDPATADRLFAECRRIPGVLADVEYLLRQPGVQPTVVRRYFEEAGLLRWFDELLNRL